MRELLADNGSIYVHLDWHVGHYVKVMMDEIFGYENCQNEVIWRRGNINVHTTAPQFARNHETILFYSRSQANVFNRQLKSYSDTTLKMYKYDDNDGRGSYRLQELRDYSPESIKKMKADNRISSLGGKSYFKQYLRDKEGVALDSIWEDIPSLQGSSSERLGFATQKPEVLLKRIILASSNPGDIVADFFCGSGTTGAVAEKLGRRWIMADLSRYAIHTTRKRMLGIENCKPFVVQNLGRYERQYWQGVTFKKRSDEQTPIYEYIQFILKLYNAEPLTGMLHIHGKKGKRMVHIGAVDAPVTLSEIQEAIAEVKKVGQDSLDILGWEWEMGLHDVVENEAKANGIHLRLFNIPRDVMDQRAVEKGDITFYELAYLEVETIKNKDNMILVQLKDFAIPNLDLIPEDVRKQIKKWSDYIDYWAVDWDWNEDTFHNMWQSYRTRKERTLELKSEPHQYSQKGRHLIMVKVIDIFGNDTTKTLEVYV